LRSCGGLSNSLSLLSIPSKWKVACHVAPLPRPGCPEIHKPRRHKRQPRSDLQASLGRPMPRRPADQEWGSVQSAWRKYRWCRPPTSGRGTPSGWSQSLTPRATSQGPTPASLVPLRRRATTLPEPPGGEDHTERGRLFRHRRAREYPPPRRRPPSLETPRTPIAMRGGRKWSFRS
jgi:hypothetical protein